MRIANSGSKFVGALAVAFLSLTLLGAPYAKGSTQQETLSRKQARWLIAHAETPAQHAQLAAYYRQQAKHWLKEASEHTKMAATYPTLNASKQPSISVLNSSIGHCRYWAEVLTKRAHQDERLAAAQAKMAQATAIK